ncbi:MAG TPA: damage-inducible protein CinA [Alphaproteobacteria bacterium]|nr:damage-inducible protein CinA [Alphaproteobacteria bacterium]
MSQLEGKAAELIEKAKKNKVKIAVAESCTGGMLGAALTSVPGSSEVFLVGFITYSNTSKIRFLKVPEEVLKSKGAVSAEVAKVMAVNACLQSEGSLGASVTGIAGPGGATAEKPIGLVYIGLYNRKNGINIAHEFNLKGNRDEIRKQAVDKSLELMLEQV